jgi:hypothetical protein
MLLDAATVCYRRNAEAAMCAWRATDKHAFSKLQQLLDCSLIKLVTQLRWEQNDDTGIPKLWVRDVIKSIATRKAHSENRQCMTRVWLRDQVCWCSARR